MWGFLFHIFIIMKNNSSRYQKLFSSIIPKEFPEVYDLRVWTRKRGIFSLVYIIGVYLKQNVDDIDCEKFAVELTVRMESLSKYFEARDRFDVRIHDSNGKEICKAEYYSNTSDTGPF